MVLFVLVMVVAVVAMMLVGFAHVVVDIRAIAAQLPLIAMDVAPLGLGGGSIAVLEVLV